MGKESDSCSICVLSVAKNQFVRQPSVSNTFAQSA